MIYWKIGGKLWGDRRQRVYAHFFLGMSYGRIARLENVRECSIRESIRRALKSMEKFLQKNL